jgi:hippurate hydrolase
MRPWTLATCGAIGLAALFLGTAAGAGAAEARKGPSPALAGHWVERVAAINKCLDAEYPNLLALYKHLHTHPELSYQEERTSARLARELKALGFEVTTGVGGHGVVGVLHNGKGPTVLVRTDMDALPVTEATGLPYASTARARDREAREVGVMHACGHDMHMTCWTGVARVLVALKDRWQGTLVLIGQPAEEVGGGARRMLEDGLFRRFPRPDYCLALHCDARQAVGDIAYSDGLALANVDSVDILIRGKGGHGAAPHTTIDPIVIAARLILDLQTLVSREINPTDSAVVTVGSIHGGSKHNIIPPEVKLQLTVRTFKDGVREHILQGISRMAKAAAAAAGAPEPVVRVAYDDFTPAVYNDRALAERTAGLFGRLLGEGHVHKIGPVMGGEDFARYGRQGVPIFLYFLGTVTPQDAVRNRSGGPGAVSLHSDHYYPLPEPSIRNGVLTMTAAVLNILGK